MKPTSINTGRVLLTATALASALVFASWTRKPSVQMHTAFFTQDTVPANGNRKADRRDNKNENSNDNDQRNYNNRQAKNIDEVIEQLNRVDMKAEMDKAMKNVNEAMKNIDAEKLSQSVADAIKQ